MSTFLESYLKSLETKVVDDVETVFKEDLINQWNQMIKNQNFMQLTNEILQEMSTVVLNMVKKF